MREIFSDEVPTEEDLADGLVCTLPPRKLGPLRAVGYTVLVFAVLWLAGTVVWLVWSARGNGGPGNADWSGVVSLLAAVPLFVSGVVLFLGGLAILSAHSSITVRGDELCYTERLGPLSWTWRRPASQLARCLVLAPPMDPSGQSVRCGPKIDVAVLIAEFTGGRRLLMAPGYPKAWLTRIANALAARCAADRGDVCPAPTVEVVDHFAAPRKTERFEPPAETDIALDRHPRGIAFTIPPAGIWKGSRGLFLFSLIWCSITLAVSVVGGGVWQPNGNLPLAGVLLFAAIFWTIGIVTLCVSINMGRRQAVLAVVGDSLQFLQVGPFGRRRHEWSREQITDVTVGPSGVEINDVPILELQVRTVAGKKHGLLSQRDPAELEWIATVVRHELRLGLVADAVAAD